jgi:hypothetical protein
MGLMMAPAARTIVVAPEAFKKLRRDSAVAFESMLVLAPWW